MGKKRGRPKGRRTELRPIVDGEESRCWNCQSTRREPYRGQPVVHEFHGEWQGKPYTHVVWRATRCLDCGQARTDRSHRFEPDKPAGTEKE